MKHVTLEAWSRTVAGSGGAHAVRAEGFIPGILIGHKEALVPLKVKSGDMTRILKQGGRNALVDLNIEGQSTFVMVREFTRNPITRQIVHVDFQRVSADEPIETAVTVVLAGHPAEGFEGYVPSLEVTTLLVKAVPDKLPGHLTVDAATLQPNHPLHAGDLPLPEGVTLGADAAQIVAVLMPPSVREEAAEEEPAAAPAAEAAPEA